MCGIAGIYSWRAPVDRAGLEPVAAALAHRGPDGRGIYCDGPMGLVHTRLAIIDLAHGAQPLYSDDGMLAVVANGEIYNYVELRAELEAQGHRFATNSDCEPLLYAYRQWGEAFLSRIEGMYAFALYDRARGKLLLARDRLGIKPLFLAERGGRLHFASELKALFRLAGERPTVDAYGLLQYLQNAFATGASTLCRGIERVLPGEAVLVGERGIERRWRYWSPLAVRRREIGFEQAADEFEQLMTTVCREHLRSDVPFGLFLSGGVDSSVLLALLRRHAGDLPLRTYSVGFPASSVESELDQAAAMARRCGTEHVALHVAPAALWRRLPHAVWAADELMADPANLPVSFIAERAALDVRMVFSGEGGDEVFAGYGRYRRLRLQRLLADFLAPGSGGFRTRPTIDTALGRALFGEELLAAARAWRLPFIRCWRETPEDWTDIQRMQYTDTMTWLPDDLLVKADRMSMAHGLEARVPYLDHRVVEFGLALPDRLKVANGTGKIFLRRFGERLLPKGGLDRPKRGFTVPVRDMLRAETAARLAEALASSPAIRRWFRPEGVRVLADESRSQGRGATTAWRLLQFALWHRLFVESDGGAPGRSVDPLELLA